MPSELRTTLPSPARGHLPYPARRLRVARAIPLLLGLLALPAPAHADLKLCNFTESRVGVAIGYKDTKGWVTEGWWNILARACETLITGELKGRFYYVHAIDYDRGGGWAGKTRMCIDDAEFTIRGIGTCATRGHKELGFYEVDTGENSDYTIRLVDPGSAAAAEGQ